ncbi:MAG: B12-binding domain-containing radical SAM protein [Myxococcales bacterium]|nr:B12-binding domain-containing radical SAM protein [Myxococcales bacterium]
MRIALVSFNSYPSLAIRNLATYVTVSDPELASRLDMRFLEYDISRSRYVKDSNIENFHFTTHLDQCLSDLIDVRPDLIGFSCYLWNVESIIRLSDSIKALLPGCSIVLGGPNAGPIADEILTKHPHIDFIIDDTNGEVPFAKLCEQLLAGDAADLSQVPSLCFRKDDAPVRNEADYEFDIDLLRGVYDRYPPEANLKSWYYGRVVYETQRGCPYKCSFCFYSEGKSLFKDDDAVIDELSRMLKRGLNVELADATFTTRMSRAKKILGALAAEPYTGSLYMQAYPSSLDEEMVELLSKNRVEWVAIGLQTTSAEGLAATRRRLNKSAFETAVGLMLAYEVPFWVDLIYGLPDTTVEDFLATLDYVISLGVKVITPNRLLGLPGTEMMKNPTDSGLVFGPSPPYEMLKSNTLGIKDVIFCGQVCQPRFIEKLIDQSDDNVLQKLIGIRGSRLDFLNLLYEKYGETESTRLEDAMEAVIRAL